MRLGLYVIASCGQFFSRIVVVRATKEQRFGSKFSSFIAFVALD